MPAADFLYSSTEINLYFVLKIIVTLKVSLLTTSVASCFTIVFEKQQLNGSPNVKTARRVVKLRLENNLL